MKLKAVFIWTKSGPECIHAGTDLAVASEIYLAKIAEQEALKPADQIVSVELYSKGKRRSRRIFRDGIFHSSVVHFTEGGPEPKESTTEDEGDTDEGEAPSFKASKAATALAEELGIDLSGVVGTGADGLITKTDVAALSA